MRAVPAAALAHLGTDAVRLDERLWTLPLGLLSAGRAGRGGMTVIVTPDGL